VQCGFQFFARKEVVRSERLLDPAVEALNHAVCPGGRRRGQAGLDAEIAAGQVESVPAPWAALAQTEEAVGELLPGIGRQLPVPVDTVLIRIGQARSSSCRNRRALAAVFALETRTNTHRVALSMATNRQRRDVSAAGRFVSHLRQILDVRVRVRVRVRVQGAGRAGLERLVLRPGVFRLQVAQIADPVATQAAVQP
jgi:hypothetical protein